MRKPFQDPRHFIEGRTLGEKIRNQARIVPQLVFFIDEVEQSAERIEDLIKNLNIPKE